MQLWGNHTHFTASEYFQPVFLGNSCELFTLVVGQISEPQLNFPVNFFLSSAKYESSVWRSVYDYIYWRLRLPLFEAWSKSTSPKYILFTKWIKSKLFFLIVFVGICSLDNFYHGMPYTVLRNITISWLSNIRVVGDCLKWPFVCHAKAVFDTYALWLPSCFSTEQSKGEVSLFVK